MHQTKPLSRTGHFFVGLGLSGVGVYLVLGGMGLAGGGFLQEPWITILAGIVFLLPGLGLIGYGLTRSKPAGSYEHTNKPDGDVYAIIAPVENPRSIVATWVCALSVTCFMTMFWGLFFFGKGGSGDMPDWMLVIILGLFTAVALLLLSYAVWLTHGVLRFGNVGLCLSEAPACGGRVAGYLELHRAVAPVNVSLVLKCFVHDADSIRKKIGEGQATANIKSFAQGITHLISPYWQAQGHLPRQHHGMYARYSFNIDIPENLPGANWSGYSGEVPNLDLLCRWELKLTADIPGPDLSRTFEIPVNDVQSTKSATHTHKVPDVTKTQLDAMRTVTLAELAKGTSLEDITSKFESLGITNNSTHKLFHELVNTSNIVQVNAIKDYLSHQAQVSNERKAGNLMVLQRRSAVDRTENYQRHINTWDAPRTLLATESTLVRGRGIGIFLILFGTAFAGMTVPFMLHDKFQPGMIAFILVGIALVCFGIYKIGQRKQLWFAQTRGCIEEFGGFIRLSHENDHIISDYNSVSVSQRWAGTGKHSRRFYEVKLSAAERDKTAPLSLGLYYRKTGALNAALRTALTMRLDLVDNVSRGSSITLTPEQLNPLLTETAGKKTLFSNPAMIPDFLYRLVSFNKQQNIALHRYDKLLGEDPRASTVRAVTVIAQVLFVLVPLGLFFYHTHKTEEAVQQRNEQRRQEHQLKTELSQKRFSGYEILPDIYTQLIYVTGKGIHAENQGNDLYIKIDEIRLEKHESVNEVDYEGLGINVYNMQETPHKNLGSVTDRNIRGKLSKNAPVFTLADQVFVLKNQGQYCKNVSCSTRLLLGAQLQGFATNWINTQFAQVKIELSQDSNDLLQHVP